MTSKLDQEFKKLEPYSTDLLPYEPLLCKTCNKEMLYGCSAYEAFKTNVTDPRHFIIVKHCEAHVADGDYPLDYTGMPCRGMELRKS